LPRWTSRTFRMTPTSGSAISASRAISPGVDIPISSTTARASSGWFSRVSGSPNALLRFPADFPVGRRAERTAAVMIECRAERTRLAAAGPEAEVAAEEEFRATKLREGLATYLARP